MFRIIALVLLYCSCLLPALEVKKQLDQAIIKNKRGDYTESLDLVRKVLLSDAIQEHSHRVFGALTLARHNLNDLQLMHELDALIHKVYEWHQQNLRIQIEIARFYPTIPAYGYGDAGKFFRGHHVDRGKWRSLAYRRTSELDRQATLSILQRAQPLLAAADDTLRLRYWQQMKDALLLHRSQQYGWALSKLSAIAGMPDYTGDYSQQLNGGPAACDRAGNALFYERPQGWQQAKNDGERWRYALAQVALLAKEPKLEELGMAAWAASQLAYTAHEIMATGPVPPKTRVNGMCGN